MFPLGLLTKTLYEQSDSCHVTQVESCMHLLQGDDKPLARPTSRCILFDGENISFDASLVIYTGYPRRNVPDFGRVFLMLKYTDITQNIHVQS